MALRWWLWQAVSVFFILVVAVLVLLVGSNLWVAQSTKSFIYQDIAALPNNRVGVLLGTSKYARLGGLNDHYTLRINAAVALYEAGKIDYVLISGDNGTPYYNEPTTIRNDLLKRGIPASRIYRDYAGFRTFDSMVRAANVFGLKAFTIISQTPHNQRAIYIARSFGLDAIGFSAGHGKMSDAANHVREWLAKVLAVLDVMVLGTQPKVLGPVVEIGVEPTT